MDLGLADRVAVVLASSGGLGKEVARALAAEGARVAVSGRDPARLEATRAELAGDAPEAVLADALDVTDGDALARHLDRVRERWGAVEVLVCNAGGPPPGTAADVPEADLDRAYALTLRSAVRAIQHVLPGMRAAGWGRILALTSLSVRQPIRGLVTSNAMRAGLTAYLKTLADEVAAEGVLVNSLCTGMFATDRLRELFAARARASGRSEEQERRAALAQVPLGRFGDPAELGAFAALLVSERASFLTGTAIALDGGAARSAF